MYVCISLCVFVLILFVYAFINTCQYSHDHTTHLVSHCKWKGSRFDVFAKCSYECSTIGQHSYEHFAKTKVSMSLFHFKIHMMIKSSCSRVSPNEAFNLTAFNLTVLFTDEQFD